MLAAVESLEARVISRLPLRPSRAGTMIRISDTSLKHRAIKFKNVYDNIMVQSVGEITKGHQTLNVVFTGVYSL
jgi:hypothetical protein